MIPRLKEYYEKTIVTNIQKEFSLKNKLMVPKITKVILNMGLGQNANDKKILQNCIEDISLISGQLPAITRFKKSISNFKTRKGMPAGVKVTLRKNRMYEFIDRLVIPEINLDKVDRIRGMDITLCTTANNKKFSFSLLKAMNFPFNKIKNKKGVN